MKSLTKQTSGTTAEEERSDRKPQPQSTLPQRGAWILTDRARRTNRRELDFVIATAQRFLANGAGRDKGSNPTAQNSRAVRRASPKDVKKLREENVPQWLTAPSSVSQQTPNGNSHGPPERDYFSLITLRETEILTSKKRSGIYQAIAAGTFPKQVKLGGANGGHGRRVAWVYGEIMDWNRAQVAHRDLENAHPKG